MSFKTSLGDFFVKLVNKFGEKTSLGDFFVKLVNKFGEKF